MNTKWEFPDEIYAQNDDEKNCIRCKEYCCGCEICVCCSRVNLKAMRAFIKDRITKAQQEIAEQILQDIPNEIDDEYPNELLHIKDQLRKKYL